MKMYNYVVGMLRDTRIHDVFKSLRSLKRHVMRRSDGEQYLLEKYLRLHGKHLNVTNPQTFTEKLFCRMISWNRGHDPISTLTTVPIMSSTFAAHNVALHGARHAAGPEDHNAKRTKL